MSERLTNILGYLTLFAILGAIWVMFGEDPTLRQGARGEPTFEGMAERINEVHRLTVTQGSGAGVTLLRRGDTWQVKERSGYEADNEKIVTILRGVALSERREPKTANIERFDRLGLGDTALKISLYDDTDGLLLEFDMGSRKDFADGRSLSYISQKRDTRSWLVTGLAETSASAGWWLKRPLLSIAQGRVSDVIISGTWLTRKAGDQNFTLQGLRADETAAGYWVLADPARVISSLSFDDVKALANPLVEAVSTLELSTYDGLSMLVKLYEIEDGYWAQLSAAFDADARNQGAAGELQGAPEDGVAEAAAINELTRGWLFKMSEADARVLLRKRANFLSEQTE